ncbi:MAG: tRNA uridine-5-carboxymethylaminomethyl(34) synthesis GTPase MnmE [Gammaproteobacteria bacterium]|nr:tRNA uridine-5-carboxymethylaminomethyl(34) synthesis GTPase MnmE [Gammaproteobacteria bacterium]MDD9960368.1 tRNA uridine-5-carboxymethylaminomethyl(34) synthesis GTPase MnmE [Gammaproteobacteria bacterium]
MSQHNLDTICAIATAPGRGGIGIIRVSGPKTRQVCQEVLGFEPVPRQAQNCNFLAANSQTIDSGIALFFVGPNSFTGEDVLELQGHGGPQILNALLERILELGVRQARPGEFSERAFLNDKIDLLQAEAIADLIDAGSRQAARSAMRTLQGEFSNRIAKLQEKLTATRVNVEAAIDFSDEDIDVINDTGVATAIDATLAELEQVFQQAKQGTLLREGMHVVIAGKPNAGKSSLLNALAGQESAIVTDIPGTTRDLLKVEISLDGMPVHFIDTAGLRQSVDVVEQEGIRRARLAIEEADQILLVIDAKHSGQDVTSLLAPLISLDSERLLGPECIANLTLIRNKIDLLDGEKPKLEAISIANNTYPQISLSAKKQLGIELLRSHLQQSVGFQAPAEGDFSARERHLKTLEVARKFIASARSSLSEHSPLELIAEDLRLAQQALGTITGEFSSDDLLGEIFSSFCIGK